MASVPRPRTHPTVKPSVIMNKKNLTKWELRLGVWQVVAMIGVVTGCMTFAFCLGFFSGQSVGFETARASTSASSAKMPIVSDKGDATTAVDVAEEAVSEVYAKLNDKGAAKEMLPPADAEIPVIGSIKEAELPQVVEPEEAPPVVEEAKKAVLPAPDASRDIGEVWDKKADAKAEAPVIEEKKAVVPDGAAPNAGMEPSGIQDVKDGSPAATVPGTLTDAQKKAFEADAPAHVLPKEKSAEPAIKKEEAKKEEVKALPLKDEKKDLKKLEAPAKIEVKSEKVVPAPAVEAKKSPTEGARIVRGAIPKGWFAQVAAPKKGQDAEKIASQLKRSGFQVVIEDAQVRGEQYYRILVGPENNRKEAEVLLGQLKREDYLQGEPFIRMVK